MSFTSPVRVALIGGGNHGLRFVLSAASMLWAAREHALDAATTPQAAVEVTAKGRHAVTVEPLAFYWQLMRYPLVSLPWPRALAIWALVVLSQGRTPRVRTGRQTLAPPATGLIVTLPGVKHLQK